MDPQSTIVAWLAPTQQDLVCAIAGAAGMELVAIGATNEAVRHALGDAMGVPVADDIRGMLADNPDSVALIAEPGAYDLSLRDLLTRRDGPTVTLTPPRGAMDELVTESDAFPARFVPLLRRDRTFGAALDGIDQFGRPRLISLSLQCGEGEGTLWARLFDGMDLVHRMLGTPDEVYAVLGADRVPETPSELRGHMSVSMRFGDRRCATMVLSDQSTWQRSMTVLGDEGKLQVADDADASPAALIAEQISASSPADPVADFPRVLALCEAARLSSLTASVEDPRRILEMIGG